MLSSAAVSADVATLDGIIKAMYDVISGPARHPRDWARLRSLYAPGARLMPIVSPKDAPAHVRVLSPEDYIRRVEPIFQTESFWERESSRQIEMVGSIAHVLSHYESVREAEGEPFERGTNSMQLFFDGTRWWIVSVMWHTARNE